MARRSENLEDMFEVKVYIDVPENATSVDSLDVYKYNEFTPSKWPKSKRYVAVLYLPKPEPIRPDRVMYEEVKEI